jgi:adenylosuccinate synthase
MNFNQKFHCVLDGGHGSSGKGAVTTRLADILEFPNVSGNNGPNAGHYVEWPRPGESPRRLLYKALPTAASLHVLPMQLRHSRTQPVAWIGPNAGFEVEQLRSEVVLTRIPRGYVNVHGRAAITEQHHKNAESPGGIMSTEHISSTMSGAGATYAMKAMRLLDTWLAQEHSDVCALTTVLEARDFYNAVQTELREGRPFLHEVAQGFPLSLDYGNHTRHCLNKNAKVLCSDGETRRLCDLVASESDIDVPSLNTSGVVEHKPIVGWVKNSHVSDWYELELEYPLKSGRGGNHGPKFTGDHTIETKRGTVRVSDLQPGDEIRSGESEIVGYALQVLLGSALGDGHFCAGTEGKPRRTAQYQETHSVAQRDYMSAKYAVLAPAIGGHIEPRDRDCNGYPNSKPQIRYNSSNGIALRKFAERYGVLGGKQPKIDKIVADIDWPGLAIWYQDDGSKKLQRYNSGNHGYEVNFHCQGFTAEENSELVKSLTAKFGIKFALRHNAHVRGSGTFIAIGAAESDKFYAGIAPHIVASMEYKLPDTAQCSWNPKPDVAACAWITVLGVKTLLMDKRKRECKGYNSSYCIEVADNHNFFVATSHGQYINVDNCTYRNVSAQQAAADYGIRPEQVGNVYLNLRAFPIRVGNNYAADGTQVGYSGDWEPDQVEMDWRAVGEQAGMPEEEIERLYSSELTSVTKKLRRVASFSYTGTQYAARFNGANALILNFTSYIDWASLGANDYNMLSEKVRAFTQKLEDEIGLPVVMLGTGPSHHDYCLPHGVSGLKNPGSVV